VPGTVTKFYNSAVVIDVDGSILGRYRKMHLPNDPCYCEEFYFAKGNLGFKTYQTKYAKIGVLLCWDQWFPEAARLIALSGAQILFYPTAIGWMKGESKKVRLEEIGAWEIVQRAHAIANGIFVAAVNRVGREGRITFWGNSFVAGPFGEVLRRASRTREETVITDCDLSQIKRVRRVWSFLRERRVDVY
ncbi:MAG: acyltransferase, partial [Candidatus Omnitrophica bacterium]|nr:acyltransferase [Candidatus Omnitrophota bacterium]